MKKNKFEFLKENIYFDQASGAPKPDEVIDAVVDFYKRLSINPHSIDSKVGVTLSEKIKTIREKTGRFSNVTGEDVIFTSGATDGLNRVAYMLESELRQNDEIILNELNHASNVIVWIELAKRTGAKLVYADNIKKAITNKTKIIAIAEINNTVEDAKSIKDIYNLAHPKGIYLVNDAAQSIAHKRVDANYADFTIYSTNKLYGPTGLGVLLMSKKLQDKLPHVRFGGGANATFSKTTWTPHSGFISREAGTPNTAGIIMHGAALDFIESIGFDNIINHETKIANYAYDKLKKLKGIRFASKRGDKNIIFNIGNINSQDVVSFLGHRKIILRAGQHCVRLIGVKTGEPSWIRASIGLYNEKSDVDKLVEEIKNGGDFHDFI